MTKPRPQRNWRNTLENKYSQHKHTTMGYTIEGTFNQVVKRSGKFGGALVVFEGHPELLVGGFNFNLADLPAAGDVLPCGTPVYCDEAARTIVPVITGKVTAVDGTKVTIDDHGFGNIAFKVGATVAELGDNLATAAENYATIASIDGNEITLSAAVTGLAVGDILVEVDATTKKVKAVPNALLPYDVVPAPDAISVDGDGMIGNSRPVLTRRMPPINDAIKAAVQANGHKIVFSDRK